MLWTCVQLSTACHRRDTLSESTPNDDDFEFEKLSNKIIDEIERTTMIKGC